MGRFLTSSSPCPAPRIEPTGRGIAAAHAAVAHTVQARPNDLAARELGTAAVPAPRAARRSGLFSDCHHMPHVVLRGTSTAAAPKPRLLDSCAAAVYAAAARPSRDPRRPVCRALLPSLPALLDHTLTMHIYAAASAATRTATLVAPAPRLFSARAPSLSPSRAVVGSQGSITSPPLLSHLVTLSIFCSRRVPRLSARHRPLHCAPRS